MAAADDILAKLPPKRRAFVEFYCQEGGWNGTKAAKQAGYSERSARQQASRLLSNADIQDAIKARIEQLKVGADEVLVRLAEQARGAYSDYISIATHIDKETGRIETYPVFDFERCQSDGKLHLIKKWKYDASGNLEVEFYDTHSALVQLGRHHKLFTDRAEVGGELELGVDDDFRRDIENLLGKLSGIATAGPAADVSGEPDAGATSQS